jgi:hypothetical protein
MGGKWLEENVLGTFVYVFLIMVMKATLGVVSYGTDEGVGDSYTCNITHNTESTAV